MSKTEAKAVSAAVKSGFTYAGDSMFKSYRAGRNAMLALTRKGFLAFEANEYGGQYVPTGKARDFVTYGPYYV